MKGRTALVPVAVRSIIFVRIAVGLISATQGFLKYADLNMGVNRFSAFLHHCSRPIVGAFEMACGILVLIEGSGTW